MLIVLFLRLLSLGLLALVLLDGATASPIPYYAARGWHFAIWDLDPDLPAAVFALLRLVVSLLLCWEGWSHLRYARLGFAGSNAWAAVMVLLLLLFQPAFPIPFTYHWWLWVDLAAFAILAVHSYVVSKPLLMLMGASVARGESPVSVSQGDAAAAVMAGYRNAASVLAGYSLQEAVPADSPGPAHQKNSAPPPPAPVRPRGKPPLSNYAPRADRTPTERIADLAALRHSYERRLSRDDLPAEKRAELERYLHMVKILLDNAIRAAGRS